MGLPNDNQDLRELVKSIRDQRDWVTEINNLVLLIDALNDLGKVTSVREVAGLLQKSKSWVGDSLVLAKGFKLYPEIVKCRNRYHAQLFLQKKNKMRRFLNE